DPRVALAVAQGPTDATEQLLVGEEAVDVFGCDGLDRRRRAPVVVPHGEGSAVLERAPQMGVDGMDAVTVRAQVQLVDDTLVEEPDDVGARTYDPAVVGEGVLEGAG